MNRFRAFTALLLLALTPWAAHAGKIITIRLCTEDVPFLPGINSDPALPGDWQILLSLAARQVPVEISEIRTSWRNCQQMLSAGTVDALNGATYAAIQRSIAVFPMRNGEVDARRALGTTPTYLLRRVGSTVTVRKGEFVNLGTKVGIMNAYQLNALSVAKFGGIADDNSRSHASLARRLTSGDLDLIAGGNDLLRQCAGPFKGMMERLPVTLDEAPYYLAFSPAFYQTHKNTVESLWNALDRQRNTPGYRAAKAAGQAKRDSRPGPIDCPLAR